MALFIFPLSFHIGSVRGYSFEAASVKTTLSSTRDTREEYRYRYWLRAANFNYH